MILLTEIKSEFDKRFVKSYGVRDEIDRTTKHLHEKNISYGSEFIDDAIRTKDQPFRNYELYENKSSLN